MGDMLNEIDFKTFEDEFHIPQKSRKGSNNNKDAVDAGKTSKKDAPETSKPKLKSLMEHTRLRNIAICTRRLPQMPTPKLLSAINSLDIQVILMATTLGTFPKLRCIIVGRHLSTFIDQLHMFNFLLDYKC